MCSPDTAYAARSTPSGTLLVGFGGRLATAQA